MIRVESLTLRQGAFTLENLSLTIPDRAYGILMGRTGCGKSSLLECIAGLRTPQRGRITLGSRDVTHFTPAGRNLGYVPQDGALFPSMTVGKQLGFALRVRKLPEAEIQARIMPLAEWLGITHLLDRLPKRLSGGEAQRVALGRALAFEPEVLLLDEPLSSVDEETRESLMQLLERLRERRQATILHITHSRGEAMRLGEVRLRLHEGRIEPLEAGP